MVAPATHTRLLAATLATSEVAELEYCGHRKNAKAIIFSDDREPPNLSHHDSGLRMLQHIRDEAHHFANSFNAELRSKKLRESILDDFKGLGPAKRQALLQHFGSIEKLRTASAKSICQVEGIGPKTAERLISFLQEPA